MVLQLNDISVRFILFVFITVGLLNAAFAQISSLPPSASETGMGGVNSIVGTVLGPSGQPIARRLRIKLSSTFMGDRITMTDENGNFAYRGLPSGHYTVIIDKEKEFEPVTSPVSVIQLRGMPAQTYTMNIRLQLLASKDSKPGVLRSEFANVPGPALAFYNKAAEFSKAGQYKEAAEQLLLAIAEYPAFMLAFNELGVSYLRTSELDKAAEAFRSALKIEPDAYAPQMNYGIVLFQTKQFAQAEPLLRNVVKMKQESAVGHYFLGQVLANLGRFDEGEKELVSAVALGGEEIKEAHRILAIIYNVKGDKKKAIAALETYLRLTPQAPDGEQLRKVLLQLKQAMPSP